MSLRARWEPLYEVTQIKGDSEAHPFLSPDDGFADFETWDRGNVAIPTVPKTQDMLQYEYAREALKNGLRLKRVPNEGVDPVPSPGMKAHRLVALDEGTKLPDGA